MLEFRSSSRLAGNLLVEGNYIGSKGARLLPVVDGNPLQRPLDACRSAGVPKQSLRQVTNRVCKLSRAKRFATTPIPSSPHSDQPSRPGPQDAPPGRSGPIGRVLAGK